MKRWLVIPLLWLTSYLLTPNLLLANAQEIDDTLTDPPLPPQDYQVQDFPAADSPVSNLSSWLNFDWLTGDSGTRTLFIANKIGSPWGSIMKYPRTGPLTLFYQGLDAPEGLEIDPTTGDLIVLNDAAYSGGFISRVLADGSQAIRLGINFGAEDDLVVDNNGYIFVARHLGRNVSRVAPDGSWYEVVVPDAGPVEELAFDPATNDVYWGSVGPQYLIGKIPGGTSCPCPRIRPPIPVTAMAFDQNDEIPGADLVISRFYYSWIFLVDFETATFTHIVPNPGAAEDLAIWNGRIIYPDIYNRVVYEINPITKFIRTLIPKGQIRAPSGVTLGLSVTPSPSPTPTPTPTPTPGKLLDVPLFRQYSEPWGPQEYDHGYSQGLWCGATMTRCGCATTSIAMVLKYHGVDYDPYGNPTTPETVNSFFREKTKCKYGSCNSIGYAFGGVVWSAANRYSKEASARFGTPKIIYNGGSSKRGHEPSLYREEINSNKPVILAVPHHFVVATGYKEDTFSIHDPYFNDRTQLDHLAYDNTSLGYHLYKITNTDYSNLEIAALAPTQVLITDPEGYQTGLDSITNTTKEDIPNSTYFFDPATASQSPLPPADAGIYWIIISTPPAGNYQIQIFNPDGEPGSFAIYASDRGANLIFDLFETSPSEQPLSQVISYSPDPNETPLILQVSIDIKPGSDTNLINCKNQNGIIPVVILSTGTFDATTIDHTSVAFAGAVETHVNKKTGLPQRHHEEDVDGDGDLDLVFHFRFGDTNLTCQSTEAVLFGETNDRTPVRGLGKLKMIGNRTKALN